MEVSYVDEAIAALEKANADLEPELLAAADARKLLRIYTRAEALAAYGKTVLARRVSDAAEVARATGTSIGKARAAVETGEALASADVTREAMKAGRISGDQAAEIARAETACPGSAESLLQVASDKGFNVLREKARKVVLETEQHRDLGARQRSARRARSHADALGMIDIHLRFEPHIGTPIAARAEAEAARLQRAAKSAGKKEPFDAHLADAYARMLGQEGGSKVKGRAKRPELVVLVSHEVAKRGWKDVRKGEVCKKAMCSPPSSFLPPAQNRSLRRLPPRVAKEIAGDAFLNGVFYDGTDLRHFKRWSKHIPIEVAIALELGEPPGFDGVTCVDCGNRLRIENDHAQPRSARGPTSLPNLGPRCWPCHQEKTARDRKAGKLKPPDP